MSKQTDISVDELATIEQYLWKQLTPEAEAAFEQRLKHEKDLTEKVHAIRLLLLGVQEHSVRQKMDGYHQGIPAETNGHPKIKVRRISAKTWLAAACLVVIAAIGILLFAPFGKTERRLFADYYQPDPGLITAMGTPDNYDFDRAMIHYKMGEYKEALGIWQTQLAAYPNNDTLQYFTANALLPLGRYAQALSLLKKVTLQPASYFYSDACWYAGLILLKTGEQKEAAQYIGRSNNPNREALLRKLKAD